MHIAIATKKECPVAEEYHFHYFGFIENFFLFQYIFLFFSTPLFSLVHFTPSLSLSSDAQVNSLKIGRGQSGTERNSSGKKSYEAQGSLVRSASQNAWINEQSILNLTNMSNFLQNYIFILTKDLTFLCEYSICKFSKLGYTKISKIVS